MASPPPLVEDQTDEDFFDKLVDDEFGVAGSRSESADIVRVFSNLSIGDVGASLEDSGDAGFVSGVEDRRESGDMQSFDAPEKDIFVNSDSFALTEVGDSGGPLEKMVEVGSADSSIVSSKVVESGDPAVATTEMGSPGSLAGKGGGSKGTSVREVQWSAFSADPTQLDTAGFGSYSDFLTENSDGSANKLKADADPKSGFIENPVAELSTYLGSSEQQDAQVYGSGDGHITNVKDTQYWENLSEQQDAQVYGSADGQITDVKDTQYWENLYPGWKFDPLTGQWYQLDSYDATVNAQLDSSTVASVGVHESSQDMVQEAGDGFVSDERLAVSYMQQTAQSVLGTIAEDSTTGSVSNWNQVSQGSMEYPPNMVFDPQYPDWYYDTNTQQWHTLESYTQTIQRTVNTVQHQMGQDVNASVGFIAGQNHRSYNEVGQFEQETIQGQGNQEMGRGWDGSMSNYGQQNMWQHELVDKSGPIAGFSQNQQIGNFYNSMGHAGNYTDQQVGSKTIESVTSHGYGSSNGLTGFQSSVPAESIYQFNQPKVEQSQQAHLSQSYYNNQNTVNYSQQPFQGGNASFSQSSYASNEGRSSAGRPPHALVTFGFGGKLVVMKDLNSFGSKFDYGSQDTAGVTVSIHSLMEVVTDNTDASSIRSDGGGYFRALCQQSFPGPLVGGNAATKDVNKWIDERITNCESSSMDFREGELLRLLLSLLKISCQHYGKLRSPFSADPSLEETDGPESAVTKLFASARRNGPRLRDYGSFAHCMQNLPSEGQIRTTAVEVQNLLVSGRRKEALQCAQDGQLWGPALVLAAQLGEKFYVDTVKRMAHCQFISGSPLRTLCLLIAGQHADVFSADSCTNSSLPGAMNAPQQPSEIQANGMLDDWEENLAIITANRTKDDELVIVHLGDCLWKERGEITAAHTCYLVAEANFESFSDSARLCLIGADHWKCPRTYASPDAIQRTELYEYSKVLGNSQFILLPFQPYKLIYAYMLAEVGKISDSLRYCQASLKSLKNSGRAPEVEMWKSLLSSLEERLRTHQQGGYSTNLAPAKLVGKLFTSIDRSIHRMIGAPPSPLPPMPQSSINGKETYSLPPKVANSQSTMAMSSLIPSASVESISEWTGDGSRKTMHNRSISEPDFGRSPKQGPLKDAGLADAQSKGSAGGPSRFGRIGSQLLQKTMGWVSRSRPDRQAKLGETNKFYYDEKLKRWVEEGAEPPAEEAALPPPPPTTASFQNGMSDYNINGAFKGQSHTANGVPETKSHIPSEHSSGIPPMPPSSNQFSARGRMGVRSRYVDTFNKGGGAVTNSLQSPSVPSLKPGVGAKFFIPTTPATYDENTVDATVESIQETSANGDPSTSVMKEASFSSPSSSSSSSLSMQRYPSMDNISPFGNKGSGAALRSGNGSLSSRTRAASWSGSYTDTLTPKMSEIKPSVDGRGVPLSFIPNNPPPIYHNGGSFGDDLHEVEL